MTCFELERQFVKNNGDVGKSHKLMAMFGIGGGKKSPTLRRSAAREEPESPGRSALIPQLIPLKLNVSQVEDVESKNNTLDSQKHGHDPHKHEEQKPTQIRQKTGLFSKKF